MSTASRAPSLDHGPPSEDVEISDEENADLTGLEIELYAHLLENVPLPALNPEEEAAPVVLPVCPNSNELAVLTKRGPLQPRERPKTLDLH
ncbi:hypothetical protein ABVK25_011530 [Lepraria finkii]|uniref:Uncharacterized protein n=1 Tax=Lepraria finkii TaxID=1340010 RepID=A0ABR4ANV5_9LECA